MTDNDDASYTGLEMQCLKPLVFILFLFDSTNAFYRLLTTDNDDTGYPQPKKGPNDAIVWALGSRCKCISSPKYVFLSKTFFNALTFFMTH